MIIDIARTCVKTIKVIIYSQLCEEVKVIVTGCIMTCAVGLMNTSSLQYLVQSQPFLSDLCNSFCKSVLTGA